MIMDEIFEKTEKEFLHGAGIELVKIIDSKGSTPRSKGAYMIVTERNEARGTIGGGKVEYLATLKALELLKEKKNGEYNYNLDREGNEQIGMVCGGDIKVSFTYLEPSNESLKILKDLDIENNFGGRVYIFGAGHVSQCLEKVLNFIGFDTIIIDDREEFANKEKFPLSKEIIVSNYDDIMSKINIKENDYVAIMTRGHAFDYEVEKQVLNTKAKYIGVIGSHKKIKVINEKLMKDGFSEERIKEVHTPIGLEIGAQTPEEIAISVAAEIIQIKEKQNG
ncbi:MAG: xanthine dehydrogenase accessory protein XdhC [Eubacteriales bacterium]|nr:xanthine dehydrogenase accessory protein XdhC [Eubacteriales bacterium]